MSSTSFQRHPRMRSNDTFRECGALLAAVLLTLLPAFAHALPDDITFMGDWSHPQHVGIPGAWAYRQTWNPDRISTSNNTAKIEVHPGDKVGGWSGERAEVSQMQDIYGKDFPVTAASGHEFYAISAKIPTDWRPPAIDPIAHAAWGIFIQLHGPDNLHASPAIALCAENDFHLNLDTGDLLDGNMRMIPRGAKSYAFLNGALNAGKWVQFVMDVHWSADAATGSIAIFRRDEGKNQWQKVLDVNHIATLQYAGKDGAGPHYWKAGFYRSASPFISTLSLGAVIRGISFDAVVKTAFGSK